MTFRIRVSSVAALLAVLGLPAVVSVQSGADTANAGREWPTVTGEAGNMRYSPLNKISAQNVARLGAAWTSEKLDAAVSPEEPERQWLLQRLAPLVGVEASSTGEFRGLGRRNATSRPAVTYGIGVPAAIHPRLVHS